jgi:hypothetical protein
MDAWQNAPGSAIYDSLIAWGIPVVRDNVSNGGLLHHKYMIIDPSYSDPVLITGSCNWTHAAFYTNRENCLIIHNPVTSNLYLQEFKARYGEAGGTIILVDSPDDNDTVSGIFNIRIIASDINAAIDSVKVCIGNRNYNCSRISDSLWEYNWNTNAYRNGVVIVEATAWTHDSTENVGHSPPMKVMVYNGEVVYIKPNPVVDKGIIVYKTLSDIKTVDIKIYTKLGELVEIIMARRWENLEQVILSLQLE